MPLAVPLYADVAFLRDPLPLVAPLMGRSLAFSIDDMCDEGSDPVACNCDPYPAREWLGRGYACTGFYYAAPDDVSLEVLDAGEG
eukprot:gene44997-3141_t